MKNLSRAALSTLLLWPHLACHHAGDKFLDAGGIRIRYQASGQGTPVVLLHGFGETLESWQRAGIVQLISPHFRVIAMDVRGHGRSAQPGDATSYGRELALDVVRLLDREGAARAHVVGYSMGALIALDVAAFHPDRVLSLVVVGAGWPPPEVRDGFQQQAAALERGDPQGSHRENGNALAALLRGINVLSETEVRQIKAPVLALIGTDDRFMPHVERLSSVVPHARIVTIPGANHATTLAHPRFSEELLEWLLKQP